MELISLPQTGGCVCRQVRFTLREDPVTVYACHCTDCQTETGSSCTISAVIRSEAVSLTGETQDFGVTLADGRIKSGLRCRRCAGGVGGGSRGEGLQTLEGGTFDDTSWIAPAGHIWAASAQPWVRIPEGALQCDAQPNDEDWLAFTRAWKARSS